jgi:pilus assembly protein Flp/PilA
MTHFRAREKGQGLVEYALILVLVAIVVIAILLLLGPIVGNVFSNVVAVLDTVGLGGGGSQQIQFVSGPSITKTGPFMGQCQYAMSSVVSVTQNGNPVSGVSVGATVVVKDNDGNQIATFTTGGTTAGNGRASVSASGNGSCGGQQGTVSISGGPSRSVAIP